MGRHRLVTAPSVVKAAFEYGKERAKMHTANGHHTIAADYVIRGLMIRRRDAELLAIGAAIGAAVGQPALASQCAESLASRLHKASLLDPIPPRPSSSAAGERLDVLPGEGWREEVSGLLDSSGASAFVACEELPGFGRGLIANSDLRKGFTVFAELPLFAVRRSARFCSQCLRFLKTGPSAACDGVGCSASYCSAECMEAAAVEGHAHVCQDPSYRDLEARLMADATRGSSAGFSSGGVDSRVALTVLLAVNMCLRGAALGEHPRSQPGVNELSGALTYDPATTLDATGAVAVQIGAILQQPHFYLEDLLTLLAKAQSNEFVSQRGHALFRTMSLLNHSCVPNAEVVMEDSGHAVLRTLVDVPRGQQLFIDYTAGQGQSLPYAARRELMALRHFECYCAKCVRKR